MPELVGRSNPAETPASPASLAIPNPDRPLRVAVLGQSLGSGGGLSVGLNFVSALGRVAPGHRYLLVMPAQEAYSQACAGLPQREEVFCRFRSRKQQFLWENWRLPRLVRSFRPDVLLSLVNRGLLRPPCPQAILVQRAQLFYPINAYPTYSTSYRMLVRYHCWQFRRGLKNTQLLLAQTPVAVQRLLETYAYQGRIAVCPNAVSQHALAGAVSQAMPEAIRPYRNRFKLFCLAAYYPHKNLEAFLDVFRQYREALEGVTVVLTISPDQHPGAARLLKTIQAEDLSDCLVNVGPVSQESLSGYYRHCQATILPTLLESFSATYLEAMRFGSPVLTSDLDFARGVCGDSALYFDPHSPASIRQAILTLKANPSLRVSLATRGLARFGETQHSWDEVVAAVVRELAQLVPVRGDAAPAHPPAADSIA